PAFDRETLPGETRRAPVSAGPRLGSPRARAGCRAEYFPGAENERAESRPSARQSPGSLGCHPPYLRPGQANRGCSMGRCRAAAANPARPALSCGADPPDPPAPRCDIAQVLVRTKDSDLIHRGAPSRRGSGNGVVRLPLLHRPHHHSQDAHRPLRRVELREQCLWNALVRLVALEQLVAKRADRIVEGHRHVGESFRRVLEQRQHRGGDPHGRLDRLTGGRGALRLVREVGAKKLVRAVDQVKAHAPCNAALPLAESGDFDKTYGRVSPDPLPQSAVNLDSATVAPLPAASGPQSAPFDSTELGESAASTQAPGLYARFSRFRERHKRLEGVLFFLGGFCFDLLLLERIDSKPMLLHQGSYLVLLSVLLGVDHRFSVRGEPAARFWRKVLHFRTEVIHFLFGTLLNAFLVFYFKAASGLFAFI